jgi:hypothetical protein
MTMKPHVDEEAVKQSQRLNTISVEKGRMDGATIKNGQVEGYVAHNTLPLSLSFPLSLYI